MRTTTSIFLVTTLVLLCHHRQASASIRKGNKGKGKGKGKDKGGGGDGSSKGLLTGKGGSPTGEDSKGSKGGKGNKGCSPTGPTHFRFTSLFDVFGRPGEISVERLVDVETAFVDAYNEVAKCTNRGAYRTVHHVRIIADAVNSFGIDAGSNRRRPGSGLDTRPFTLVVEAQGTCEGCPRPADFFRSPTEPTTRLRNLHQEAEEMEEEEEEEMDLKEGEMWSLLQRRIKKEDPEEDEEELSLAQRRLKKGDKVPYQGKQDGLLAASLGTSEGGPFGNAQGSITVSTRSDQQIHYGKKNGPCECPAPLQEEFLREFNALLQARRVMVEDDKEDLRPGEQHRQLQVEIPGLDEARDLNVLVPSQNCTTPRVEDEGYLSLNLFGDSTEAEMIRQIRTLETAFIQTYNDINALSSTVCDPCRREITDAIVQYNFDFASLLEAGSVSPDRRQRVLQTGTTSNSRVFQVVFRYMFFYNPAVCDGTSLFQLADGAGGGRQRRLWDGVENFLHRELQVDTPVTCLCAQGATLAAPSQATFLDALNETLSILDFTATVQNATVNELAEVSCESGQSTETFQFTHRVIGETILLIQEVELRRLEQLFVQAYNEVARKKYCDRSFLTMVSATVRLGNITVPGPNGRLGQISAGLLQATGISTAQSGRGRKRPATQTIGRGRRYNRDLSSFSFDEAMQQGYISSRRLQSVGQNNTCFCRAETVGLDQRPTIAELLQRWSELTRAAALSTIEDVLDLEELAGTQENDSCQFATGPLTTLQPVFGDTTGASIHSNTPTCGGLNVTTPGLWYVVTGTGSQSYVTTCMFGLTCDTVISVYEGRCGALTCVGANDDAGPPFVGTDSVGTVNQRCSAVEFYAADDVRYYVLVHGFSRNGAPVSGPFRLLYRSEPRVVYSTSRPTAAPGYIALPPP
jgi:hypothetical protein